MFRRLIPTRDMLHIAKVVKVDGDGCTVDLDGLELSGVRLRAVAFTLEILLEQAHGDVAQFFGQVAFKLPFYGRFQALEMLAEVLNFHDN